MELTIDGEKVRKALKKKDEAGFFTKVIKDCPPGTQYQYVLDNSLVRPDPASAYQPQGVHGVSQVVDHGAFGWTDEAWQGVAKRDLIIYELHVGTFTPGGTFSSAIERLSELVELGVTAVELMPVAQCSGRWNWGYDGVDLFAVQNTYGGPDGLKALVDACHGHGLAVLLDVVYNHLGPEGNYLGDFGPYLSHKHHSPWGECFNFDGDGAEHVRRYVVDNALSWLDDYHMDGLRLDATHYIQDDSQPHLLDELQQAFAKYQRAVGRTVHLIAETNVYDEDLLADTPHRSAYDAVWSDCQMHSYYAIGTPQFQITDREYRAHDDLARSLSYGYVYAGASYKQELRRRTANESGGLQLHSLVVATQNHDAVGNHPAGKRLHQLSSKSFQKAAAALTLLYPAIPLLFMGEEFASDSRFPFFVDFESKKLRRAVNKGRRGMFSDELRKECVSPIAASTFEDSILPPAVDGDQEMLTWYRALIALRKQGIEEGWLAQEALAVDHDATLGLFSLRYGYEDGGHVKVLARLHAPRAADSQAIVKPVEGVLLVSSEPSSETDDGSIALQPNHAVIIRA